MCSATLLPEPDSPLRMMRRMPNTQPAGASGASGILPGGPRAPPRGSGPQRAARLRRVVVVAFFLVLLDAAIELVGEQIDSRVHVFLGGVGVYGVAAHV